MISDIRLKNFRSYKDESFEFDEGVNIVVGPNASGKTNLLEAILVLAEGKSYKATDFDMVRHAQNAAKIGGHFTGQERSVTWKLADAKFTKLYQIGGDKLKRLSAGRTSPAVLFEPAHMRLLAGSPGDRREYLDSVIEKINPGYSSLRQGYKRALAQRNALLKHSADNAGMFAWDVRLSELGGQIMSLRQQFIADNKQLLADFYNKISGKKNQVDLIYKTKISSKDYNSALLKNLQAEAELDKLRGFTSVGPHRDDIVPMLGGFSLATTGSRGESRTMLLALKLLEVKAVEEARGIKPILLLDDVFSELDGARRRALTKYLKAYQTFITTTDADIVVQHFLGNCSVIPMIKKSR